MQQEQIKAFLEKFAAGVHTDEEHHQFIEWLKIAPIDEVEAIAEEYKSIFESKELSSANPELVSQIEASLNQYELGKEYHVSGKVIPLRTIRKIAVAASIILAIGVGGYLLFFYKSGKQPEIVVKEQQNDVSAPTVARATLKLDDGRIVYLDSAKNGSLAKQGNVNVVKLADGQIVYQGNSTGEVKYNTITNSRGSKVQPLTLIDGTKVWLNAESSITYPTAFAGNERKISITGEAYFEVTKDASKKFIVDANGVTTEVLGTHFNVNSYQDEGDTRVTLLEESVKVSKGNSTGLLKPGQQAQITNEVKVVSGTDLEQVMAWKNGQFVLKGTDVAALMRQVARWYDVDVVFNSKVPENKFGGTVNRDVNLSTVLQALKEYGVVCWLEGKKVIVE